MSEMLAIPGYNSQTFGFYAARFAESAPRYVDMYINSLPGFMRGVLRSYENDIKAKGRLLVPSHVMEDMELTAMAHGYGVTVDSLSKHNSLYDEVLESAHDGIIQAVDGEDSGYILSAGAYVCSQKALVRILIRAQRIGRDYKDFGWAVNNSEAQEGIDDQSIADCSEAMK